jgi:hypothetical protein
MTLDLHKLENKLDETLNNETSEELFKWLNYKRRELINSNKKYLEIPHRETIVSTNTLQTKPFDNQKIQIMENKKETSVLKEMAEQTHTCVFEKSKTSNSNEAKCKYCNIVRYSLDVKQETQENDKQ